MTKDLKTGTRVSIFLAVVFYFLGICTIIGGINTTRERYAFFKTALKTTGQISNIETGRDRKHEIHYYASVTYSVDGQVYENIPLPYYTSDMYMGKSVTLFYDPENPSHIKMKTASVFLYIIICVFVLGFFGLGLGFSASAIRWRKQKKLRKTGLEIYLPITSLNTSSTSINGIPGMFIICEGTNPITGRRQRYVSDNYYSDLDTFMEAGDIVPVYLDRNHPDKYFVDVEHAEPPEIER